MNVQDVLELCNARVRFDDAVLGSASRTACICVDGTSATRKSTILGRTGCPVRKIQRQTSAVDMDTYFPSAIGYSAFGLATQNCDEPHLYDRSHLNPLEWRVLWAVMDDYVRRHGNTRPCEDSALWSRYRDLFVDLRHSYHYAYLRSRLNAVALIDSNVARCDDTRRRRGHGSDRERSDWLFYTPLQNLMYRTLYPDACIDLAWFDHADPDCVTNGIAMWLRSALRRCVERVPASERIVRLPFSLPVAYDSLTLANVTTHMYRSMRRVICKREQESVESRANDRDNDGRAAVSMVDRLRRYQPAYVTVRNVCDPDHAGMKCELPGRVRPDMSRRVTDNRKRRPRSSSGDRVDGEANDTSMMAWLMGGGDDTAIEDPQPVLDDTSEASLDDSLRWLFSTADEHRDQ